MTKIKTTRRTFLQKSLVGTAGMLLASQGFSEPDTAQRPNIVFIIGDDISVDDFGCYGHPHIRTPNIDALAVSGLRFTNAYLTTSQCSPTRCSVITGRYPHNTGAPELHAALPEGQVMFPAMLKEAGYYTVAAGKFHMGKYATNAFNKITDSKPGGEEKWVQCLQERPMDRPFFAWFASHDAHRGWVEDEDAEPHTPEDVVLAPYSIDTPAVRKDMAQYYDEIQRLDRYVGAVVKELKQQGVLENTCILFMADNGRPFARCKTRLYDSGIKTPFVMHWPKGFQHSGATCNSFVSAIDLAPTFLEMAGLTAAPSMQGVSMMPLLENLKSNIREYVFAEHNWHAQIAHERMVRHGDYVYIRNAHPQLPQICGLESQCPQKELRALAEQGKLTPAQMDPLLEPRPAEELFNVIKDPHQINNLVDVPEYRETLDALRKVMDEWQQRTGDTVPSLEEATPDRYNRRTGESVNGTGGRPSAGVVPGETTNATAINDPGPR